MLCTSIDRDRRCLWPNDRASLALTSGIYRCCYPSYIVPHNYMGLLNLNIDGAQSWLKQLQIFQTIITSICDDICLTIYLWIIVYNLIEYTLIIKEVKRLLLCFVCFVRFISTSFLAYSFPTYACFINHIYICIYIYIYILPVPILCDPVWFEPISLSQDPSVALLLTWINF